MPREHFYKPIRDGSGVLRENVTVRLLEPGVDVLISEPIYTSESGAETFPNPRVFEDGILDFYLDKAKIIDIGITPEGSTAETVIRNQWVGDAEVYKETLSFTLAGGVTVQTGRLRFYIEDASVIESVRASLGVPSSGADVAVDVLKNGTSIFPTSAKPTVVAGENTGTAVPDTTALAAGDYITLDITQIGSTASGADLVVQVRTRRI